MSGPAPIAVEFAYRGLDEVLKAMRTVEETVVRAERRIAAAARSRELSAAASARRAARAGVDAERQAANARESVALASDKRIAASHASTAATSASVQIAQARRAANESANAQIREATRVARARNALDRATRATRLEARYAPKGAAEQVNGPVARLAVLNAARDKGHDDMRAALDRVRAMKAEQRAHEAHERQITKETEAQVKQRKAIRERAATDAGRLAKRMTDEEHRARERRGERFYEVVSGGTGRVVGAVAGVARGAIRNALDLGGGFSVQGAAHEATDLEREAIRFSNAAFMGEPGEKRLDKNAIIDRARANAVIYGTDASELMAGSAAYAAESGDYTNALKLQGFFGQVAKGTGASVADIANTAGILKVQNKDLGDKEMRALVLNTIRQGQLGSVEFSDLAGVAGNFTRSATSYVGDQGKYQGTLLGLGQKFMATAGRDPREAATVTTNLASDTINHRDDAVAILGKDAFDKQNRINMSPDELIARAMQATGGDLAKLGKVWKGRSIKGFQAVMPEFNRAKAEALASGKSEKDANKAGADAVRADLKPLVSASMSQGELEANVSAIMQSSAEQFEGAVRELKTAVGAELVPILRELTPLFKDAAPPVRDFLRSMVRVGRWLDRNPLAGSFALVGAGLAGLGVSITAEVMKQIVTAKIGDTIKSLITGGGSGVPGGGSPVSGKLGKGLAVVGAGLLAGELTKEWIDEGVAKDNRIADDQRGRQLEATSLIGQANRQGGLTDAQRAKALALVSAGKADQKALADQLDPSKRSLWEQASGTAAAIVAPKEAAEAEQARQQQTAAQLTESAKLTAALEALLKATTEGTAATKENTTATRDGARPSGPTRPPNYPPTQGPIGNRGAPVP